MTKIVINNCFGGFSLSLAATKWLAERGLKQAINSLKDEGSFFEHEGEIEFLGFYAFVPRHDALLVECVEALGAEASGDCAELVIKTIEGNQYIIEEYDGAERIKEPKDIEWVTV